MKQTSKKLHHTPSEKRGWFRYSDGPDFNEDIQRINALVGSTLYESQLVNGVWYVRRLT